VTQTVKGCDVSSSRKFEVERGITRDAYFLFGPTLKQAYPLWNAWDSVEYSTGNHIITVPKNAKTDRTIAVEPGLNTWIQLGIGKAIRRRLRFAGFNLNSDYKNQLGAFKGSIDDSLATIDFSAASDTIAKELVRLVLPPVWFSVLDAARSHYFTLDGVTRRAEKFSTMGNGFTFELESLLFYCISRAVAFHTNTRGVISVYGDDIIAPVEMADDLSWVLGVLGFEVNPKKSYSSGPFRESCGGHYYNGYDITPFYVKAPIVRLVDLIHVCNQLRKWARTELGILDCEVSDLWRSLAAHVPSRFWGGHDTAFKGRLVSKWKPDKPRKLVQLQRDVNLDAAGHYLSWLDSGKDRETGITDTQCSAMRTLSTYKELRAPYHDPFGVLEGEFLFEILPE